MQTKVNWIAFATTLAFWLGCAGRGNEQNYKMLDEDRPILQPDKPSGEPMNQAPALPPGGAQATPQTCDAQAPCCEARQTCETQPSLTGLDRSNWERLKVKPIAGETRHHPTYFQDYARRIDPVRINRVEDLEYSPDEALQGGKAGVYNLSNTAAFFIEPAVFAAHMVTAPVRLMFDPPWSEHVTPAGQ